MLLKRCEDGFERDYDEHDYSIYTGTTGATIVHTVNV